jgi:energy-coupling factor transporter transmembrane protein EcfT
VDVRAIDLSATSGRSRLHTAGAVTKLAAFGLVLAGVVLQQNVLIVGACGLLLAALAVGSRLPLRAVFALAAYPGVFAVVFALAAAPDLLTGALFVVRAVTAALGAIVLVFVTPYPQIFAPLQRVLPEVVGDAMLMTYRSLFLLADKFEHLRLAIRIRSGLSRGRPVRAARATASALGSLVLYALDLAQREYDILRIRGYEGGLRASRAVPASHAFDGLLLVGAGCVFAVALGFRLAGATLTPLSWMPAALAALVLLLTSAWRLVRHDA